MTKVKVINGEKKDLHHKLTTYLALSLGLLVALIVLVSHDNPQLTGYSVFSGVYGQASPFVILVLLFTVIFLYHRLHKE